MHYNKKIIVIDTETTGLNPEKGDRIIEIACVEIKKGKIINSFHSYLNVKKKIDKKAYKIHGIKKNFLKKKPYFKEIKKKLYKIIKNSIIVSHNANFDIKFIKNEYKILGEKINLKAIDTLKIARKMFPGKKNSLIKFCERLKIKIKKKMHSAINDAKILAQVFLFLKNNQIKIAKIS
ncbi:exonuclease domain-containing protein [Candidatus Vidania fulgoroideorum]